MIAPLRCGLHDLPFAKVNHGFFERHAPRFATPSTAHELRTNGHDCALHGGCAGAAAVPLPIVNMNLPP